MSIDTPPAHVTIKDVAARAGVSPGTVSNVMNRPELVREATRRRVLEAIEETGYIRNASASRLRALDNRAIGILVMDVANYIHASLAKGAQEVAEERGFMAMLCDADRSVIRARHQIDFLDSQRVAGILATGSTLVGVGERLAELRHRGVAMVLVDAPAIDPDQCSVAVDDVLGGEIVGDHLLDLGHRHISFVKTDVPFGPFDDRLTGLRRAIARHPRGSEVELDVVSVPAELPERGEMAAARVLEVGADAAFCIYDHVAVATMQGLLNRGTRIPDDVAVIGYDDTKLAAMMSVPLSSVRQPARLVGQTAAMLLLEECSRSDHEHQHVMFRPELVARASTMGSAEPTSSARSGLIAGAGRPTGVR